jgi:hypothetical protein
MSPVDGHTPSMGDEPATHASEGHASTTSTEATATGRPARRGAARRRRVLIGDARRNGNHLRTTWHREDRVFVMSTWNGEVCTGAIRVPMEEAAELVALLVDGLADAAATPAPAGSPAADRAAQGSTVGRDLRAWLRQGRKLLGSLGGGRRRTRPPTTGLAGTLTTLVPRDKRRPA